MKFKRYIKTFETGNIKKIEFHIDNAEIQYFLIEYNASYNLSNKMKKKYGKPNDGNVWKFNLADKLTMQIWSYNNSLYISNFNYLPYQPETNN